MATYGFIENISGARLIIDSLGLVLPTAATEEIDDTDVRPEYGQQLWNSAVSELSTLITAASIEIRESDNSTVVTAAGVQAWVDLEIVPLSALPTNIGNTKLDILGTGTSVITKIIAGLGVSITETGVDAGTGFVTVNVAGQFRFLHATLPTPVPGSGESFLRNQGNIPHSIVPVVLEVNYQLKEVSIAVNKADASNDYTVRFYTDPAGTPSLQHSPLVLASTNLTADATGLSLTMNSGNWGVSLARTSGSGGSEFKEAVVSFLIVKV